MSTHLLPSNATAQECALSESVARLSDIKVPLDTLWNPWTCPAGLLPWLAWALSVDVWDDEWSEDQKRATIAASVQVHRIKGTRGAVNRALGALGYDISLVEWFQDAPKGAPYTFRLVVEVDDRGVDDALYFTLEQVVNRSKNTRSHLSKISIAAKSSGKTNVCTAPLLGDVVSVSPWAISERTNDTPLHVGSGVAAYDILTVSPLEA